MHITKISNKQKIDRINGFSYNNYFVVKQNI